MSWVVESKLCSKKRPSDPVLQGSWCRVGWSEIHRALLELKGKDQKIGEKVVLISKNVNFTSIGFLKCCSSVGWDKKLQKAKRACRLITAFCSLVGLLSVLHLNCSKCSSFTRPSLIVVSSCFTSGCLENLGSLSPKGHKLHSSVVLRRLLLH